MEEDVSCEDRLEMAHPILFQPLGNGHIETESLDRVTLKL